MLAIAITDNNIFSTHEGSQVFYWTKDLEYLGTFGYTDGDASSIVVNNDYLIASGLSGTATQFRISTRSLMNTIAYEGYCPVLAVASAGQFGFMTGAVPPEFALQSPIYQWHLEGGFGFPTFEGHSNFINALVAYGDYVFSAADDNTVKQCSFDGYYSRWEQIEIRAAVNPLILCTR